MIILTRNVSQTLQINKVMFKQQHKPDTIDKMRRHPASKVILQFNVYGQLINVFSSLSEAERSTGVSRRCVLRSAKVKHGIRTAGGFIWRYKTDFSHNDYMRIIRESNIG